MAPENSITSIQSQSEKRDTFKGDAAYAIEAAALCIRQADQLCRIALFSRLDINDHQAEDVVSADF